MISRLHDGQLQRGARHVQCKPRYIHTKPSDLWGAGMKRGLRREEEEVEEREEDEEEEGEGATKRRGDERVFLQEEEIYSVGFVQI